MARSVLKKLCSCFAILLCALSCFPAFLLLVGSITGNRELAVSLTGVFREQGTSCFPLLPAFPTLQGWLEMLLDTPEFYAVFFQSVKLTASIVAGQLLVSVPAAWFSAAFCFTFIPF